MSTPVSNFLPQPCCDADGNAVPCPEPVAFHRTTTSTAPVDHPGRTYDLTLPINPGFAVQSLQVDAVTHAANIVWDVADPDGEQFRQDLTAFIDTRIPSDAVVTITNPNAGLTICGTAAAMQIHIECLRLDQSPPNLIELVYNAGRDMVINPAYNETPPLNPPVSQGNYGFHLLAREDDPGPFPGNPPAERANCTNVANRGWETNDIGRTFEIWGQDIVNGSNVTPTPRGTPVQEMTSDGPPPGGRSTIWQTFQAPATGNFIIRVVHGARDAGEDHRITLDNGDTNDAQNGDLIDNVTTNVGVVTNSSGGPGPWTTFNQTIPLTSGSTYTLALSTNNPVGGARGGLFTDMRAYLDIPDQRATAATDDETCVVTANETSNLCTDELWVPVCTAGTITSWQNAQTGVTLTNAAFWGQAPAPVPGACPGTSSGGDGGSVAANLAYTYPVCATVGGVRTNLQRVVITDASGGVLADTFIGPDGGPVATPSTYSIGSCTDTAFVNDVVLCDFTPGGRIPFLRKYVQSLDDTGRGQIKGYQDFDFFSNLYTVSGIVGVCTPEDADREPACWTQTSTGNQIHTGTIRHSDDFPSPGWLLYDQNLNLVPSTEPGLTFVPCGQADPFATTGLCLPDGTPIAVVTRHDATTDVYTDDGWINLRTGAFTSGNPPVGVESCSRGASIQVTGVFCDMTGSTVNELVLIEYSYNPDGTIASVRLVNATTGATHILVGTLTVCPSGTNSQPEQDTEILCDIVAGVPVPFLRDYRRDATGAITATSDYTLNGAAYSVAGTVSRCNDIDTETQVLCDDVGSFLRRLSYSAVTGLLIGTNTTTLDGSTPYTPTGTVRNCASRDSESFILCDSAASPVRFLRTYTYTAAGAVAGFTDTTLAGAPFVPTGAVGVCTTQTATDFDFAQLVLCDANGTSFIRRHTFNSSTGVVTATTNVTLAGAAFAPVGAVGLCSDCCPSPIGEGCTNTGSGRYTAIRATNGTVTLIDSVSGATVSAANIVACPGDDTVRTLTAQHQLVVPGTPWTPPAGVTLTSLTYVILTGTGTVVDASGDSAAGLPAGLAATFNAEDDNTLTPPQSITSVGGQIYVHWTAR